MNNRNTFWRLFLVLGILAWSFYEMYPPVGRNLAKEFQANAARKDVTFSGISERLRVLQQERPERSFGNLVEAVGSNDLTRINQALNQTLSRTIITSGTVFLATMALFIFGGGAINDFAFTFLIGIISGTYSSIYIASAFVLWWHKSERPKTAPQPAMNTTVASRA